MKKVFAIIIFIWGLQPIAWGQDFNKIIDHVKQTPKEAEATIESLSRYLTAPFSTETEKLASIYAWVTLNIKYDVKSYKIHRLFDAPVYSVPQLRIREVWEKRIGVCEHYALLFHELSKKAGLKSSVVSGYTMSGGKVSDDSHAWNAVMVDSAWSVVDATWGAGYVNGDTFYPEFRSEYFMRRPAESILSHMPFDPLWQLLPSPVLYSEFDTQPVLKIKEGVVDPAVLDEVLFPKDEVEQTSRLLKRIKENGPHQEIVAEHLKYLEAKLASLTFNTGISFYNQSIQSFNKYIEAFNRRFKNPNLADQEIMALIDTADVKMLAAIEYFNKDYPDEKLNKKARHQQREALALHEKIKEQSIFVDKYVKTSKFFRPFLFLRFSVF